MLTDVAVNVNGRIGDAETAVVPVFDHGFLFGEGVYETLRTYNRRPFLLDRHFDRLRASAAAIGLAVPLTDQQLAARIDETAGAADIGGERYIRLLVTRGVGGLSYDPRECGEPTVVIIVKAHADTPPDVQARGIGIVVSSVMRNHPAAVDPRIKSNNLLNNALAMQEALRRGAEEALMRNHRGEFSECSQSNFFLVREGEALTPPLESGLLEGVTRNFLFEVARDVGVRAPRQREEQQGEGNDDEPADHGRLARRRARGAGRTSGSMALGPPHRDGAPKRARKSSRTISNSSAARNSASVKDGCSCCR